MNRTRLFVALSCPVFLAALAGCASTTVTTRPLTLLVCRDTTCQIPINVTLVGNQCTVAVPDASAYKTVVRFQWAINQTPAAPPVYFDPVKGIEFRDPSGWVVSAPGANAKRTYAFPLTAHTDAYYYIHMIIGQTTYRCEVDPVISNDFDADY